MPSFDTAGIEQLLKEIAAILERPLPPGPDLSVVAADGDAVDADDLTLEEGLHASGTQTLWSCCPSMQ